MPYTPPPYTAVDFDGAAVAYTPPPYTAVDFDSAEAASAQVEGSDTAFDLIFASVTLATIALATEGSATAQDSVSAQLVAAVTVTEVSLAANDVIGAGFNRSAAVAEGSATASATCDATLTVFVPVEESVYPVADVDPGLWMPSSGSELWPMLDEPGAPNFTDDIRSPPNPVAETFEVRIGAVPDVGTDLYHGVDIAFVANYFDTHFDLTLLESTTVLDTWSEFVTVAQGEVVRTRNFDPAVVALIVNRADLHIRGVAHV